MDASGLWSFVFSINFQIREIPATKLHFSCEKKPIVVLVKISEKKKKKKKKKKKGKKATFFLVWDLVATGKQIEKNFCH